MQLIKPLKKSYTEGTMVRYHGQKGPGDLFWFSTLEFKDAVVKKISQISI